MGVILTTYDTWDDPPRGIRYQPIHHQQTIDCLNHLWSPVWAHFSVWVPCKAGSTSYKWRYNPYKWPEINGQLGLPPLATRVYNRALWMEIMGTLGGVWLISHKLGGGFTYFWNFHPGSLGKIPILTMVSTQLARISWGGCWHCGCTPEIPTDNTHS